MSDRQNPSASFWFMLVIIAIGLVVAVTTIFVGYTFSPKPLGFLSWVTIGFLCLVELLATVLGINSLAGRGRKRRPSGAILMISYGVVVGYTALGLVSIIGYALIRDDAGAGDGRFTAVLTAETVLAFVILTLLYAHDFFLGSVSAAVTKRRDHHAAEGRSVRSVLSVLQNLTLSDPDLLARRDALVKRLQSLETALGHSHGGGLGSREEGWQHPRDPAAEQMVDDAVGGLNATAAHLASAGPEAVGPDLEVMERFAAQLRDAADRLQLL